MNKVELKFEEKLYRVELPNLDNFTGQLALTFHCKGGIPIEANISKKGSVKVNENYPQLTDNDSLV